MHRSTTQTPHAAGARPALDQRERLRGARLLLVEDNPINQELAVELLHDAGATVHLASDGRAALTLLAQHVFDGVLMDCQMPVMDGYETTREIRRDPRWAALPIIAMTANANSGDREKALAAGMDDHIAKPIAVDAMVETVARWLRPMHRVASDGASDPLDTLRHIDPAVGRSRTMGNDKLYLRLLGKFRDSECDFPAKFRSALARGDMTQARRLVHDLGAVAEALGARALAQAALPLDAACRHDASVDEIGALLDRVQIEHAAVMSDLLRLPAPTRR